MLDYNKVDFSSYKLLIVEDNPYTAEILKDQLSMLFKNIELSENGEDALAEINNNVPDIILCDLMMPKMDGLTLCQIVKKNEKTVAIPFIIMTVLNDMRKKIQTLELGADDYIIKPCQFEELVARLRSMLRLKKLQNDYKLKNQELEAAQFKLINNARMVAVGQLGAGIAHELNQPLTGIRGFAMMMRDNLLKNDLNSMDKYLDMIIEQTERMSKIIKNIKSFSHQGEYNFFPSDIKKPISDALMLVESQLKVNGIELISEFADNAPVFRMDSLKLQQVFLNLLQNSIDALENINEKKLIKIKTEFLKELQKVRITFYDSGKGIKEEIINDIFNPFFSTKDPDKGTGLGLPITMAIVKDHGGIILVNSILGEGATFTIELPTQLSSKN